MGRELSLRGVNARIEGLFDVTFADGRVALEPIPALSMADAQAMVRYGFNVLRLPINWSGLEPHEGELSEAYFDKLDEVVNLARDAGLYVLLDFPRTPGQRRLAKMARLCGPLCHPWKNCLRIHWTIWPSGGFQSRY